ncbi:hypothetical protein ZYGR_0R00650 [Zygosaccharomyces rouxii]|uniref:ZYRO0F01540p n=2 Tax=Zygosaccharomyces rouxii TaxID=4956 RepID=C5DX19_ZYGRC|nr:uncharacterized protein ZYRO0F01540g [Zygosaccharomyces rouxii]KAH9199095.1 alcohol acetyltransferase [Zygosaccharomyces rouxii]GAV49823.1 hypothetical protein ZYGR_0R00650 [Zygosaccharomyces rouxii]CAR28330.1 ZYRO0F01540p [Zygosaccharomyces rouxii]
MVIGHRKLSSLERYFYTRSIINLHSCFYVGIQLNQLPSRTQIQHALKSTIDTFIQLRCNVGIDEEDGKPYLKIIDQSLELKDVVEFVDWAKFDEDKMNYVFQNYAFPYHTEKPLWKVLVIPNERKLVLLMSHVLFDGMAGVIILQEFLKNLNQSMNAIENTISTVYEPGEIQSFTSNHHPYEDWPIGWKAKLLQFLFAQYLKWKPINADMVGPKSEDFKFNSYFLPHGLLEKRSDSTGGLYQVRCDNLQRNIHLTPEELEKVLQLCKDHRVSFSSLLTALFARSLAKFSDPTSYTGSQMKICLPMNTRSACNKYLQNDDYTKQLGNFVAATTLIANTNDNKPLWELAEAFQKTIVQKVQNGIPDAIGECRLLDVIDMQEFFKAKIAATKPSDTFEVSNLGFQPFNDVEGPFKVTDAFFNQPQGISANFFCSVISTGGGLNCHLTIPRDLERDLAPCIQYVDDWLHEKGRK